MTRRSMKEEHYVIFSVPVNKYVDHVVPESSQAIGVANEIMSVFRKQCLYRHFSSNSI